MVFPAVLGFCLSHGTVKKQSRGAETKLNFQACLPTNERWSHHGNGQRRHGAMVKGWALGCYPGPEAGGGGGKLLPWPDAGRGGP